MALQTIRRPKPENSRFLARGTVFAKPGNVFRGIYRDSAPGKYGLDVTFDTERGEKVLTVSDMVAQDLAHAGAKSGDLVVITFMEEIKGKYKKPFKKMQTEIDADYNGEPPENDANVWA